MHPLHTERIDETRYGKNDSGKLEESRSDLLLLGCSCGIEVEPKKDFFN
jgi:hypothetical protein